MMHLFFFAASCAGSNSRGALSASGSGLPQVCADDQTLRSIFLIGFEIIGALVLLFFVIAGLRYTLSKGEPENIQRAKNEMKYTLIGLIIVALAWSIVRFVLARL